jgi:hypothetical protein
MTLVLVAVCVSVVMVKVAVVDPAGTSTVEGTVTPALSLPRVTVIPPKGATSVRVRRALALTPPSTLTGLKLMDAMVRIRTPRVAVFETPFA